MAEPLHITSLDNPRVKDAVRLRSRRARVKSGRFLVEGRREIERALDAGHRPASFFVAAAGGAAAGGAAPAAPPETADLLERVGGLGCRPLLVEPAVHRKLVVREDTDGLLAIFPLPPSAPESLLLPPDPVLLAASGIEKPGNLGALLRSVDGFGADAFLAEGGTDLWSPNTVRASLGCVFTVQLATFAPGDLVPYLRSLGVRIVAATPAGDATPREADLAGGVALLVGSEETGLDDETLAAADVRVRIPMRGAADSLNVSVTAGILLYEADRQRAV